MYFVQLMYLSPSIKFHHTTLLEANLWYRRIEHSFLKTVYCLLNKVRLKMDILHTRSLLKSVNKNERLPDLILQRDPKNTVFR